MSHAPNHVQLVLDHIPKKQHEEAKKYIYWLIDQHSYEIDSTFLGFLDDYKLLAELVKHHTFKEVPRPNFQDLSQEWTVYDIGCCYALQHVFFPMAKRYVGIDMASEENQDFPGLSEPRFFLPNCQFVRGRFADVVESLEIDPDHSIAVSVMALSCLGRPDDWEAVHRHFKRIFII